MRVINGVDIDEQRSWHSKAHPSKRFEIDRVVVVGHVVTNDDGDPLPGDTLTSVELDLFDTEWESNGPAVLGRPNTDDGHTHA